jgi:hypothetical protein|tara:strand:+ start:314 stop:568 length:255 start_codon:yes stop_codon:yes gene_type:complete
MKESDKGKNMTIKVDKGIKIPKSHYGVGYGKYPWLGMRNGDSFFIPDKQLSKPGYRPTTPLFKTTSRIQVESNEKGVRVWRTSK